MCEWIRKNKKHKNKSIGFLFKFAKLNRRKNIQIYGTLWRLQMSQYTASKEGWGDGVGVLQNQWEHYIILAKYDAVHLTIVSENNSSSVSHQGC